MRIAVHVLRLNVEIDCAYVVYGVRYPHRLDEVLKIIISYFNRLYSIRVGHQNTAKRLT